MKLKDKRIAFGLTDSFFAFNKTIAEMKNLALEGAKIIPIMPLDTYKMEFIKEIEDISNRKIIIDEEEAEKVESDIMIIAPCSRESHCKTCIFYI